MRIVGSIGAVATFGIFAASVADAQQQPPTHGSPRPETVRIEPLQVPDPVGGPAWGVRDYRTTTGLSCSEIGRRVDDAIGTIDGSGTFHETQPDTGAWLCQGAPPGDPPVSIGGSVVYLDANGSPASCDPRPSRPDHCDPQTTRTAVMIRAGKGLVSASVRHGHTVHHVVLPRRATVFLDILRGAALPPHVRLTFRGGCNAHHRRTLLKFHDARRVGCRVVIPLELG